MNSLKLRIKWSKKENDYIVFFPRLRDGGWILHRIIGKRTCTMLNSEENKKNETLTRICGVDWNKNISVFDIDFIKELELRGFDKTTLKFEVMIKLSELETRFPHLLTDLSDSEKIQLKKLLKNSE
jgi:hypothetical protein